MRSLGSFLMKSAVCTQPVHLFTGLNFWTPKLLWSSTYDPNSTLYPVLAKFLIPNFLGTDCFARSIPALLLTSLLSKIFVQRRSQLRISGMDPGQTCLFCQKSEKRIDFWWGLLHVLNVSSPITTRSCQGVP